MKAKTVLILWAIVLVLAISIFALKKLQDQGPEQTTERSTGELLLPDFPAEEVKIIRISGPDSTVTLVENDDDWMVQERDSYPAFTRNVNDLLRTIDEMEVTQAIEAGPSLAPRFGMDSEASVLEDHGVLVTFEDSEGKEITKLTFGKNLQAASTSSPLGRGITGRYVRNHADDSGFYAVSEALGILSVEPKNWLNQQFIEMDKINQIAVSKPGSDEIEWQASRVEETGEFAPFSEKPFTPNAQALAPLKTLLAYSRFDDVVPSSDFDFSDHSDEVVTATITTFEGFTYTLKILPDAEEPAKAKLGISVSAALPEKRKKTPEETEEIAKAADEAFDDRLKTLTRRLEEAKALEGKVYTVQRSLVEPLLKKRGDYLTETPAPKSEESAQETAEP